MTKEELRHEYFVAKDRLRDIMLDEYQRHGGKTPAPDMWNALQGLWDYMNGTAKKL